MGIRRKKNAASIRITLNDKLDNIDIFVDWNKKLSDDKLAVLGDRLTEVLHLMETGDLFPSFEQSVLRAATRHNQMFVYGTLSENFDEIHGGKNNLHKLVVDPCDVLNMNGGKHEHNDGDNE
jgi:hypothetical protein